MPPLTEKIYGFDDSLDSAMLVFQVPSNGLWANIKKGNKHTTPQSTFFIFLSYFAIFVEVPTHYNVQPEVLLEDGTIIHRLALGNTVKTIRHQKLSAICQTRQFMHGFRCGPDLEFERAVKVQARPAGDLHAIASDCAQHGSTSATELL